MSLRQLAGAFASALLALFVYEALASCPHIPKAVCL